jgi:hypothetical protein
MVQLSRILVDHSLSLVDVHFRQPYVRDPTPFTADEMNEIRKYITEIL